MGANAQTSVPSFADGQVLTGQQQTEINTGIPVFATSVERDAAFGGTGEKVLAEGQYAYLEDTIATQFYDGSTWQSVGVSTGLVLVKTQTIGSAVSSVEVTGAFSSTYDNYKITINGGAISTGNPELSLQLGSTTTGYYYVNTQRYYTSGGGENNNASNVASFVGIGNASTDSLFANLELGQPNLAKRTTVSAPVTRITTNAFGGNHAGFLDNATQYTAFTIIPSSGTMTGGTIRVYGYANS